MCNDSMKDLHKLFAEFQGIVSVNDFWFPLGLQELLQASGFLVKFYIWTDTHGSIEWPNPVPRLHIGDCFETRNCRLGHLWSAVVKSPKLSARGTASPLRLLHGALVILVRLQISQFRSLGKWIYNCVFPNPHVSLRSALKKLHEMNWRESLPVMEFHHPPNSPWILAAIPESQDRHTGFPVRSGFFFNLFLVFGLAWVSTGFSVLSSTNSDTGTGEMSLLITSSLSRTDIPLYCRWRRWGWRRWRRMTLLFHRCPWG